VLRKIETEAEFLQKNIATCREKKEKLIESHQKLKKSLEQTEEHAVGLCRLNKVDP
jgi:chaperonin cofactor prefoldin